MRHVSPSFTSLGLTALSALGLLGCGTNTVDPPDPTTIHHYRVRSIDLPVNSDEARSFGFDLDGAGAPVDNQLGNAHAVLVEFDSYYQVEGPAAARLESDVAWIVSIYDSGRAGGAVRLTRGVVVDGELQPVDEVLPSTGDGLTPADILTGGDALFPLGAISDGLGTADPAWVDTELTHVAVDTFDQDRAVIRLGVALAKVDVDRVVSANLAAFFTKAIANGQSEYARDYMDADGNGTITAQEVLDDNLVRGLLTPDLQADPQGSGLARTSLSLGARLTATSL